MGIQVPLLVIDRRRVSVMSTLFSNRRVRTLKVFDDGYYEFGYFDVPKEFGVPDVITDMTRSLEMLEPKRLIYWKPMFGLRNRSGGKRQFYRIPGGGYRNPPGGYWAIVGQKREER